MKKALVTTTINVPYLLEDYCKDFLDYGYKKQIEIIVVGDLKTPKEAKEFCKKLQEKYEIATTYMDVAEQTEFLPINYFKFLPWNCIQRRNVGMLYAYANGAEIIYTIDDDNFLETPDYIGNHGKLGKKIRLKKVSSSSGWYNICNRLIVCDNKKFYPRGYSMKQRILDNAEPEKVNRVRANKQMNVLAMEEGRVVVNAGLWLGDPDIDAVTRMAIAPEVSGYLSYDNFMLAHGTKCPFNSQNTALHRDVIPAYCLASGVGRYDDIIASYFVKRIADHLGDYISFGLPLVKQKRNEHNLWIDMEQEKIGMQLTDDIVEWLYSIKLKGNNYSDCIKEILDSNDKISDSNLSDDQKKFIVSIHKNYSIWQETLVTLNKKQNIQSIILQEVV